MSRFLYGASLKDDQFNLLVWLLLSLLSLFSYSEAIKFHTLAVKIYVLTKMRLGMLNMRDLIVGQVGIKIITFITVELNSL